MPGVHNALNAAAAVAVCSELGVSSDAILRGLAGFEGVGRRFSVLGDISWQGGKALLVDDYGHHPTELKATIKAAREAYPDKRLVMVFQPHRFSRTKALLAQFAEQLMAADQVVLMETYAAGEAPDSLGSAQALMDALETQGGCDLSGRRHAVSLGAQGQPKRRRIRG